MNRPNIIYVFSDQHRSQACGFHEDPNVHTPNMDRLAGMCVEFTMAVSGMPVCCPYRASLLTGQYPHHHGIFLNDLCLKPSHPTMGELFKGAGYDTAYIGKWHLDGHGRSRNVPVERRHGFDYWKVMECTHDYNASDYYGSESDDKLRWNGYDAQAQTRDAISYIRNRAHEQGKAQGKTQGEAQDEAGCTPPFLLLLSWGPPHDPYDTAPEAFRALYDADHLKLRPNVPEDQAAAARQELAGYYAHVSALDACLGDLITAVKETGLWEDTIFIYTSDHGDMLRSQGVCKKQKPWEESIRVPFLLSYPRRFGTEQRVVSWPMSSPDILPTLLELCGLNIPEYVDGKSLVPYMDESGFVPAPDRRQQVAVGSRPMTVDSRPVTVDDFYPAVLLQCINPSGEWHKFKGGRPYRGIRTLRYTYVRDLNGPWLLYDNVMDPYQLVNLVENDYVDGALLERLNHTLDAVLREAGDELLPGRAYLERWGYEVDFLGTNRYEV